MGDPIVRPSPVWKDLVCENHTAVCSLDSQMDSKMRWLVNVRIGCCEVPPEFWHNSLDQEEIEIHEEIFRKQYNGDHPYIFADKEPVNTRLFNKYNVYYTGNVLPKEGLFERTQCPPGQFVIGYQVTNPISTYFNGNRIFKIVFTCGSREKKMTSKLDLYDRFYGNGHDLKYDGVSTTFNESRLLQKGYYNGIRLVYHVEDCRRILVEAWSFCLFSTLLNVEEGKQCATYGMAIDNWPPVPWKSHPSTECVTCRHEWAICGFITAIEHYSMGTVEGLFFKVICCPIPKEFFEPGGGSGRPNITIDPRRG